MIVTAIYVNEDNSLSVESNGQRIALGPQPHPAAVIDAAAGKWRIDLDTAWGMVRKDRNQRLADSDWTQMPDSPLNVSQKAAWIAYRQQLRDVTLQKDPLAITWPKEPAP